MISDTLIMPAEYRIGGLAVNRQGDDIAPHDCPVRIGLRIKEIRRAQGMRQQELARRAGISQTTVSDLERGRNVSSTDLPQIARALGVTTEELVYGTEVPAPASPDKADQALVALWRQLTPPQQAAEIERLRDVVKANREIARHLAQFHLDRPVPDDDVAKHIPPAPRTRKLTR